MNELLAQIHNPLLERIVRLLPGDEPVYLVGGAIRDVFLHRTSYDLDFVIPGDAMRLARRIANELKGAYFPLDVKRNMARIILKADDPSEIFRKRPIRVDFSTFQGADLHSDLLARDFTMNAMAVELHELEKLIDPFGGINDLYSKRLKACSQQSISNDPIRILRAVRFSVGLELNVLPELLDLIRESAGRITEVSAERLRDELMRILEQTKVGSAIRIMDRFGVLEDILPELCALRGIQQSPPHTLDAWEHTIDMMTRLENLLDVLAVEFDPEKANNLKMGMVAVRLGRYRQQIWEHLGNGLNPERSQRGLLFLAGLYHDVGKRKTQTLDEEGKFRFIHHEHISSNMIEKRGRGLRLSNTEIERLTTIIKHHMRPALLSHGMEPPSKKAIYRFFRDTGVGGVDICLLSMADVLATYGPTLSQERWAQHLDVVRTLLNAWWDDQPGSVFPPPVINGDELMEELEILPGPIVGDVLEAIREGQVAGEILTRQDAIKLARDIVQEKGIKTSG